MNHDMRRLVDAVVIVLFGVFVFGMALPREARAIVEWAALSAGGTIFLIIRGEMFNAPRWALIPLFLAITSGIFWLDYSGLVSFEPD